MVMTMELAQGVERDVCSLHVDAGQESGDRGARRRNLKQIVKSVEQRRVGKVVLVIEDANSLYSRKADDAGAFRTVGLKMLGLRDLMVSVRSFEYLVVNYVTYVFPIVL